MLSKRFQGILLYHDAKGGFLLLTAPYSLMASLLVEPLDAFNKLSAICNHAVSHVSTERLTNVLIQLHKVEKSCFYLPYKVCECGYYDTSKLGEVGYLYSRMGTD